jgi:hypothetical protein
MLLLFHCQFLSSAMLLKDFRRQFWMSSDLCSSLPEYERDEEAKNSQAPNDGHGSNSA